MFSVKHLQDFHWSSSPGTHHPNKENILHVKQNFLSIFVNLNRAGMAYRVFVGGVPAWADHGLVKQWCWHNSLQWPDHIQVVRRWQGETQIVCFLCFHNYRAAATALDRLKYVPFQGHRISVKWSRDSMPHPRLQNNAEAGTQTAGATGGSATEAAPAKAELGATQAAPAKAELGATEPPEGTASGSTGSGANAVLEKVEKIEEKTELAEAPEEDGLPEPVVSTRSEAEAPQEELTPTEEALSPTEPASPSSECPTAVVPPGQAEAVRMTQVLYQAQAELLEIKEELKSEDS